MLKTNTKGVKMATTKLHISQLSASQIIQFAGAGYIPDANGCINLTSDTMTAQKSENLPKKSICEVFLEHEDDYKKLMQAGGIRQITIDSYVASIKRHGLGIYQPSDIQFWRVEHDGKPFPNACNRAFGKLFNLLILKNIDNINGFSILTWRASMSKKNKLYAEPKETIKSADDTLLNDIWQHLPNDKKRMLFSIMLYSGVRYSHLYQFFRLDAKKRKIKIITNGKKKILQVDVSMFSSGTKNAKFMYLPFEYLTICRHFTLKNTDVRLNSRIVPVRLNSMRKEQGLPPIGQKVTRKILNNRLKACGVTAEIRNELVGRSNGHTVQESNYDDDEETTVICNEYMRVYDKLYRNVPILEFVKNFKV